MKQHPVDELFARRLAEHSLTPKRAGWEELQKRMQPQPTRRIGVGWWYASAAGISTLLLAGWWFWPASHPLHSAGSTVARRVSPATPTVAQPQAVAPFRTRSTPQVLAAAKGPVLPVEKAKKPVQTPSAAAVFPERLPVEDIARLPEPAPKPTDELTGLRIPEAKGMMPERKPTVERTLVVQIEEPEGAVVPSTLSETEQPRKRKVRLGRLLRQLNNLREGEPVDWKDVGVDGNALLAKATESVETGRERITESVETIRTKTFSKQVTEK